MPTTNTTLRNFSLLTAITVFEKIISFVYEAVIASVYGASIYTDAYFSTAEVYTLIDSMLLSALTVVALNRFSFHVNCNNSDQAFRTLSGILSVYLPVISGVSVLLFLFAKPLSYVAAPGFYEAARNAMVRCIRCMAVVPVLMCMTSVCLAVLRQKKRYEITGLKSLFISGIGIVGVLLFGGSQTGNADALSVSYVISMILYGALTFFIASRYGTIRFVKPAIDDEIKTVIRMVLPLMLSYGISSASLMIDKMIASLLGDGFVSSLTYAHSLYRVVEAVFITNLAVVLLTDFNDWIAQKKTEQVGSKLRSVASIMTTVLIPITIVTVVCRIDIVKIVYERGQFSPESTVVVGSVLVFYALNFVPAMLQAVYNQVMYAAGDTRTPMWIALLCIAVNFGTSLPLVRWIGLPGVAVGTWISCITAVLISRLQIKKYIPEYHGCYTVRFVLDCALAGILSATVAYLIHLPDLPALVRFLLTVAGSFTVYYLIMFFLKDPIVTGLIQAAGRKMNVMVHSRK